MKTLKILSALLFMTLCIGFTSCSSDDDDDNNDTNASLVGTWYYSDGEGYTVTMVFEEDGGFYEYETEDGYSYSYTGTYTCVNNQLVILYDDGCPGLGGIVSVTSNTLTITETETGITITLSRIQDL
ncbi:MAG: lipocalin family protein [Prevotellaceae bacterium]|nr:lipocalin family protein [Prevotellaceae bacterium]